MFLALCYSSFLSVLQRHLELEGSREWRMMQCGSGDLHVAALHCPALSIVTCEQGRGDFSLAEAVSQFATPLVFV